MTEDFDVERYQQTTTTYRETKDALRAKLREVGDAFHAVGGSLHGAGTPLETGLKLQTAGHRLEELGRAMIAWNTALDAQMQQVDGHS